MLHNISLNDCFLLFNVKETLKNKKGNKEIYDTFNNKEIVLKSKKNGTEFLKTLSLIGKLVIIYQPKVAIIQNYIGSSTTFYTEF